MVKDFFRVLIIIFFSTLLTGLIISILFKSAIWTSTPIFFYRGLKIICLAGLIGSLLTLVVIYPFFTVDVKDFILSLAVPTLLWILFFTHIPVTAERSVSLFLLGYMRDNPCRHLSKDELQHQLSIIYINEFDATDKRIQEQIYTGTIVQQGKDYKMTPKGFVLLQLYDTVADIFNIKRQLLNPCQFSKNCVPHENSH